jgi:sugar phosphate isomerase/epimerase
VTVKLAAAEWMLEGETLEEKYAFALTVGFDGIELSGKGDGVFAGRAAELRAARDAGVQMPSAVMHLDHFIGDFDPDQRRDAIDQLKVLLTTIGEAGGLGVVAPHAFGLFSKKLPPFTPPRSDEESRSLLVAALMELGAHAESVGTTLFLEPLNRYEDFVVNTLADASWFVDQAGTPGVAVIADTFHMSIEETKTGDAIREAGSRIKHVQLGDSDRLEPGHGHYDWDDTLDALEDIKFDGWLAMECGLSGPGAEVLPLVSKLLKR